MGCRLLFREPTQPQRRLRRRYRLVAPTPGRQSAARVWRGGSDRGVLRAGTPASTRIVRSRLSTRTNSRNRSHGAERTRRQMSQLRKRFDQPQHHPGASRACAHQSDVGSGHWPRTIVASVRTSPRYRRGQLDVELDCGATVYLQRGKVVRVCRIGEPVHFRRHPEAASATRAWCRDAPQLNRRSRSVGIGHGQMLVPISIKVHGPLADSPPPGLRIVYGGRPDREGHDRLDRLRMGKWTFIVRTTLPFGFFV